MGSELPLRVLVVDDDETACAAITGMLESLGHRADYETDSLSALKGFCEDPDRFDLAIIEPLLLDLMGLDLAICFRRIRPGFPVLFHAGYVDESLSRRIEAEDHGGVVFKPVTLNELAAAIKDRLSPGTAHGRRVLHRGPIPVFTDKKRFTKAFPDPACLVKIPAKRSLGEK